jgi:hypothetical protein
MERGVDPVANRRYGVVLGLVVVNILVIAVTPSGELSRLLSAALAVASAVAALHAAGASGAAQRLVRLSAGLVLLGAVIATITGGGDLTRGLISLGSGAFVVLAPLVIFRGLLRQVLDEGVDMHVVAGALAIYMLIGLFFAFAVAGVSELASSPYFVGHAHAAPSEDVYFSFITLSTVGYGDYTPALGIGRGLSILEGVAGQLYLVTVVALLIGNLRGRHVSSMAAGRSDAAAAPGTDSEA